MGTSTQSPLATQHHVQRRSRAAPKKAAPPPLTPPGALPCRPPSRRPSCLRPRNTDCRSPCGVLAAALRAAHSGHDQPQLSAAGIALSANGATLRPLGSWPAQRRTALGCRRPPLPLSPAAPRCPQPSAPAEAPSGTAAAAGPPRRLCCGLPIPSAVAEGHPNRKAPTRGGSCENGGASHVPVWHGAKLLPAEKATGEAGLPARLRAGQPATASDSHVLSDPSAPSILAQQPAVLRPSQQTQHKPGLCLMLNGHKLACVCVCLRARGKVDRKNTRRRIQGEEYQITCR